MCIWNLFVVLFVIIVKILICQLNFSLCMILLCYEFSLTINNVDITYVICSKTSTMTKYVYNFFVQFFSVPICNVLRFITTPWFFQVFLYFFFHLVPPPWICSYIWHILNCIYIFVAGKDKMQNTLSEIRRFVSNRVSPGLFSVLSGNPSKILAEIFRIEIIKMNYVSAKDSKEIPYLLSEMVQRIPVIKL